MSAIPVEFFTNHGLCILLIARRPSIPVRELASSIGITERCCKMMISELEKAGYVTRNRETRRTFYEVHTEGALLSPAAPSATVGAVLAAVQLKSGGRGCSQQSGKN